MVETAEPRQGDDLDVPSEPSLRRTACGRGLGEAEVGAVAAVVRDVLAEQAQQVAVVEDDDMVEELATDAADPTLRDAVLPRAPRGGAGRPRAEGLQDRSVEST